MPPLPKFKILDQRLCERHFSNYETGNMYAAGRRTDRAVLLPTRTTVTPDETLAFPATDGHPTDDSGTDQRVSTCFTITPFFDTRFPRSFFDTFGHVGSLSTGFVASTDTFHTPGRPRRVRRSVSSSSSSSIPVRKCPHFGD